MAEKLYTFGRFVHSSIFADMKISDVLSNFLATLWKMGLKAIHGPHYGAQQSRIIGVSDKMGNSPGDKGITHDSLSLFE